MHEKREEKMSRSEHKGLALLIVCAAIIPFALMTAAFFSRNVVQASLTARSIESIRAFWAAEEGAARAEKSIRACALDDICTVSGTVIYDTDQYQYNAVITDENELYYRIDSTGTGRGEISQISSIIKLRDVDPGKFEHGIETQGDIQMSGSAQINPAGSAQPFSTLDFEDLFGFTKEEIRTFADNRYLDPPNNVVPCDGITWVDVQGANKFRITNSAWHGSGILIINGDMAIDVDATITGGKFDGIIYITGELEIPAGNPVLSGTVLVEDAVTDITKLLGNLTINYDQDKINDALDLLRFLAPHNIAWWENSGQ